MNLKLLAIDGNSIINRAFYGVRLLQNKHGMYTNAIFGFLNILLKLEKDHAPDATVFAFDLKAPTFRHVQYAGYKANRKGMPEELAAQMPVLKEILTCLGYTILEKEGYEADDILGTLSRMCIRDGCDCVIATGDRDALQLVEEQVSVCLVKTKENVLCNVPRIQQDYGVLPMQIIDIKALMGDASDNIPGVKGIGEKTAMSLIQKNGSLEQIYSDLDVLEATPRVKKLLAEGKEAAFMSRDLATICLEVPVAGCIADFSQKERKEKELSELLTQLELFSFFTKLGVKAVSEVESQANSKKKQVTVLTDPPLEELTSRINNVGKLDFLYHGEALLFCMDDVVVAVTQNKQAVLEQVVVQSNLPKRTFMAKALYKMARSCGTVLENLTFDVELAAYLLNTNSKGYDLTNLIQKYLPYESYDVAEEYLSAAAFSDLCDALEARVTEEGMLSLYREIELPLCEALADMEQEGFAIDVEGVQRYGEELQKEIDSLKLALFEYAGHTFNPNSTKELGVILFDEMGLPPKKKTKTGYSTNVDVLESLRGKHPIIETLLEYRKLTKLHSTYIVGLLKVTGEDGRVHSTFNQTETRTGRISSTEPNVQNIPVRTEEGSKIRKFFIARDGYTLVDADYSQIELRILAHIADDKNMIHAFENNVDIHQMTAAEVFKLPLEEVPAQLRSRAKAINFGIVYGIGAYSLSQNINVPMYEAKEYIEEYLKTYHGVAHYMKTIVEQAQKDEFVTTLYHRKRELGDINATNKQVKAFAERVALNTPIQGTAADIIKIAMIRVFRRLKQEGLDAKLILQVHDELIIEAQALQAPVVAQLLKEEMQAAAKLHVALLVDVHTGRNWYQAKG